MPQSLMERLQLDAVDSKGPVADLLRKAKLAAVKLSATDLAAWIEHELSGYPNVEALPDYRILSGPIKFFNPQYGWCPITGAENAKVPVLQSVGELAALVSGKDPMLTITVPDAYRKRVHAKMPLKFEIRQMISAPSVSGIIDLVRNRVLDWSLKLEQAGVHGHGLTFTPEEQRVGREVSNIIIHGHVGSLAHGQNTISNVVQNNTNSQPQEMADALATLLSAISRQNVSDPDVQGAIQVIASGEKSAREGKPTMGARIRAALDMIRTSEDVALKAPEVAQAIHDVVGLLG